MERRAAAARLVSAEGRLRGIRCGILTASDSVSKGRGEDGSGNYLAETLRAEGAEVLARVVVPDHLETIAASLTEMADRLGVDLVLTTGGSGAAPRDVTPEATLRVVERQMPGIPEAARIATASRTPLAMLSRAVAGIRGRTLIVNLPGSPKAVREWMDVILPVLRHTVELLHDGKLEWGREHRP
ncbi:MAG TPA: MogA/MoaB family molybdenum cofactor biosynthesis protein [bacterium]|nr:MogA/MoaB family molybdenum cofactor biosynthesis protein [bacterium]